MGATPPHPSLYPACCPPLLHSHLQRQCQRPLDTSYVVAGGAAKSNASTEDSEHEFHKGSVWERDALHLHEERGRDLMNCAARACQVHPSHGKLNGYKKLCLHFFRSFKPNFMGPSNTKSSQNMAIMLTNICRHHLCKWNPNTVCTKVVYRIPTPLSFFE